jgi:hypothetical protein
LVNQHAIFFQCCVGYNTAAGKMIETLASLICVKIYQNNDKSTFAMREIIYTLLSVSRKLNATGVFVLTFRVALKRLVLVFCDRVLSVV